MESISIFQRLESAAILAALLVVYYVHQLSWSLFILLILVPDISMMGYLKNPRVGATIYNIGHSYFVPILILLISGFLENNFGRTLAIIWAIHIAGDRMLGFGLKLPTSFKDTHLGRLK